MDPGPRFEEHIKTAHPFKCEQCDLRYVEAEKLRKHIKSHHQKGKSKTKPVESVKERNPEGNLTGYPALSSHNSDGMKGKIIFQTSCCQGLSHRTIGSS